MKYNENIKYFRVIWLIILKRFENVQEMTFRNNEKESLLYVLSICIVRGFGKTYLPILYGPKVLKPYSNCDIYFCDIFRINFRLTDQPI